jgi:hypothetical protein
VTVLSVDWEGAEDADVAGGVSTETLGDDVFASTIQASVIGDNLSDDLDEAEIERSIREINEAIRRSSEQQRQKKS